MDIPWKSIWKYAPDIEEALVRYALTFTILLLGIGILMAVAASGLQLPEAPHGRLKSISESVSFALVALVGFTLAIELRASNMGWHFALRVMAVLGLFLAFVVSLSAPYLFPQYVGVWFGLEPHPLAVAGVLMVIAASASGVNSERANIRIIIFLMAAFLAWVIAYFCGYLFHNILGFRGSWRLSGSNLAIVAMIAMVVGLGLIARWLPDADDRPKDDNKTGESISELAGTILPPSVLVGLRRVFLLLFVVISVVVIGAILDAGFKGRLNRPGLPMLSAPASGFLAVMAGFWAFAWPFRNRSKLFSMLARVMLPILVLAGIGVVLTAVFFEYQAATQVAFLDPIKQATHPLSASKVHKIVIGWSLSSVVLVTALVTVLAWKWRNLRLFTAIASLAIIVISFGPLSVNSSFALRINNELKPILEKHALDDQGGLRAREDIKWTAETAILARALVMRLAGVGGLGDLPMLRKERTSLFEQDASSILPSKRLSAVLERLNLGPVTIVAMGRPRDRFRLNFRVNRTNSLDVAGYDIAFETGFDGRSERRLNGRKTFQYWTLTEMGELHFSIEGKISARFDLAPILKPLLERQKQRQRLLDLNRIARETGGTAVPIERPEENNQKVQVLNSLDKGADFRILLQELRVLSDNGKFRHLRGRGWLLIKKQALAPLTAS